MNLPEAKRPTFQQFFLDHLADIDSSLPKVIQNELVKGHCLLLFDGLDEVADESLRRRIRESIHQFISTYSPGNSMVQSYNRFIVTSRIVGYEAASFDSYAHYTLLDLEDEQIEQFLTNWFLAVGRRLTQDKYGAEKLLPQQEEEAQNWSTEQRDLLLNAIKSNPGVKRLAVNPLSLTILALSLLKEGKALPHRRINLYQKVTLLFLDSQNQGTGRKTFSKKEVRLAEQILSRVAYQLHSSDRPLTTQEVKEITRETMADFYRLPVEQIDPDERVEPFIETLRRSSGLFVEIGPNFFAFMHRTFQEYYVAMYLSSQPLDELTSFVREHYSKPLWREPVLLLIASKSEKNQSVDESDTRQQADVLLRAILNTTERCDTFLQRNLLFAATSLLDCDAGKIDKVLQQDIANHLFDLYSDSFSSGRFIQLQQEIEKVVLLWLQEQPSDLLKAWSSALCDDKNRVRQEGAVRLLAAIAPDLADCPRSVLHALIPPLLQLAEALDISYPPEEIQKQLPKPAACSSSLKVHEYAFVALCLLDAAGPAGWLYQKWFRWSQEHPDSLGRLNEHARDLQIQLLHANNRARYPHTYLFWRLLKEELKASNDIPWRVVWDAVLQEEMMRGHSATFQSCLYLRLLLWKGNKEQNQKIAHELMKALLAADQQQMQAITFITNIYLLGLLNLLEPQIMGYTSRRSQEFPDSQEVGEPLDFLYLSDFRKFPEQLELQKLRDLRSLRDVAGSQIPLNLILYFLRFRDPLNLDSSIGFLLSPLEDLDIPNLLASLDLQDLLRNVQDFLRDLRDLQDSLDLRLMRVLLDVRDDLDIQVLLDLRTFLDSDYIAEILCNILVQQSNVLPARVLLALYSIISGDTSVPSSIGRQIQTSIQAFRQQAQSLTREHSLLITAILKLLNDSIAPDVISVPSLSETPDLRATALQTLQQEEQLTKSQVEEILAACIDTRELSEETQKEVKALTVQQAAWQLLNRPFSIEEKSVPAVVQALGENNTIVCAAAALLLQKASTVPASERNEAVEKILAILTDDELSRCPLNLPEYTRNWQLNEVLFETLKVLAEEEG